jgi:hypothetical protein
MARGHHRMRCDLDFWRNDIHARQRRLCLRDRADRHRGASTWGSTRCHSALHSPLGHGLGRKSPSIGAGCPMGRRLRIWLPLDAALDPCAAATPGERRLRSAGLAPRNRLMELDCAVATLDCL